MENPAEVQELRNKLRMMKFPQDEIINIVRRQQRAIQKQKTANDTLKEELNEYEKVIHKYDQEKEENKNNPKIIELESSKKSLSNKLGILQADYKAELEKTKQLEDEVSKLSSSFGSITMKTQAKTQFQKQNQDLYNKLDLSYNKYNNDLVLLENLRNEIDELRKQKIQFNENLNKIQKEEKYKDNEIAKLISESNEYYTDRDRLRMEIVNLKNSEKEDETIHLEEYKRLSNFIDTQGMNLNQNRGDQQAIPSIYSQTGSNQDQIEAITKETDQLTSTFNEILEITNQKTLSELIENFYLLESTNFSLYTYITEQFSFKSNLQEQLIKLEYKQSELYNSEYNNSEIDSKKINNISQEINKLENILNNAKEDKIKNFEKQNLILEQISLLCKDFEFIDPETSKYYIANDYNYLTCLCLIEGKIVEMMSEVSRRASLQQIISKKDSYEFKTN